MQLEFRLRFLSFVGFLAVAWAIPNRTMLVEHILKDYNRNEAPDGFYHNVSTEVKIGLYLNTFYSVNEQAMEYSINIYLRQQWKDPRLAYSNLAESKKWERLRLHADEYEKLWFPDTSFRNEKRADFHRVTVPNRMVRLEPDGTVFFAQKLSLTLACPMFLRRFPMDTQSCPIQMESFGYMTQTLYYTWLEEPVDQEEEIEIPQYQMKEPELVNCTKNYSTGSYSCLQINFVLTRDLGYYMIQVYIPTALIVVLSWMNFWISVEAIPARVTIGLLSVLTITTQSASGTRDLPKVSYVKAIDIWLTACLVMVFAALLEFAVVNVIYRKSKKNEPEVVIDENSQNPQELSHQDLIALAHIGLLRGGANGENSTNIQSLVRQFTQNKIVLVDRISRFLFPLLFGIFNAVYWGYFQSYYKFIEDGKY